MSGRVALFVRIPAEDAELLDRAAFERRASKQDLVAEALRASLGATTEVLTLEEAADLMRLGPAAARTAAEGGELPGRRIGGRWRFSRRRLLEWIEARET